MAENYREFNPLAGVVLDDHESEDETLEPVNVLQQTWPQVTPELQKQLHQTQRLDGLIVAAETMQIARNGGVLQFYQFPAVVDRHLNRFKGLKDFFGSNTKHLYEFSLCSLGAGISLSAIVATTEVVKVAERPTYSKMVPEYHNCVRRCILKLPMSRMTAQLSLLAPNAPIQIYQEDWVQICDLLNDELQETAEKMSNLTERVFPKRPKFFWVAKLLGQNLEYKEATRKDLLGAYRYAIDLQVTQRYAVAVHCAVDVHIEDNIMFWNPPEVSKSHGNLKPSVLYHVGLIPGLANMTYANVERENFSYVQYYSRVFAGAHRDSNNVFMFNGVAKSLYNRYYRKLSGFKKQRPVPKELFINDVDGKLAAMFNGLRECCKLTTPARFEAVWTMPEELYGLNDVTDVIAAAFRAFEAGTINNRPMFHPTMVVNISTRDFANRLVPWINVIESTIRSLAESVQAVEKEEKLWNMDVSLVIPGQKFLCVQVAEWLMHVIIKGKPHKSYPNDLGDYLGLSNQFLADFVNYELLCGDWPFQNTSVDENNILIADHPDELEDHLCIFTGLELTENPFLLFAEQRKEFCALPLADRNSRENRQVFKKLATQLLDLILFIQKARSSSSNWGEITLKMLFLEKIDFTRKIRHFSAENFVTLLAYPGQKKMSLFEETKKLAQVLDTLKSDTSRFTGFRDALKKKIEDKIKEENCPLRFSYGKIHDLYVYSCLETHPPLDITLSILDKGLIDANKSRSTSCTIGMTEIVQKCKDFLRDTNFSDLAEVASSAQDVFDGKKVKTTRRIPMALRKELLSLCGNSNEDEADNNGDSSSEDDDDEQSVDVSRELEPIPRPSHSVKQPTTSVYKKKARNPSKTRSQNTRLGMLRYHAKKRNSRSSD